MSKKKNNEMAMLLATLCIAANKPQKKKSRLKKALKELEINFNPIRLIIGYPEDKY